jgi:hypothetical protein
MSLVANIVKLFLLNSVCIHSGPAPGVFWQTSSFGHEQGLNLVQVQKWSFALEETTDLELDLVYFQALSAVKPDFERPLQPVKRKPSLYR